MEQLFFPIIQMSSFYQEIYLRRYAAPARGSKVWKKVCYLGTALERINAYLKEFFQFNNVRYRTGKPARVHFDLVTLIYNASKLAAYCIYVQLGVSQAA